MIGIQYTYYKECDEKKQLFSKCQLGDGDLLYTGVARTACDKFSFATTQQLIKNQ